jgi:hypothetical protein
MIGCLNIEGILVFMLFNDVALVFLTLSNLLLHSLIDKFVENYCENASNKREWQEDVDGLEALRVSMENLLNNSTKGNGGV